MGVEDCVRTPVIVETSRYRIRGEVSVPSAERLSDYANAPARDFFAVTNAHLAPLDAPDRERRIGFILVARHEIGVMLPGDEAVGGDSDEARERVADDLWSFMQG